VRTEEVICIFHLNKIYFKRKKEKKESSCISNADKKTKSRSRINDGYVRWGCVYGGCLFVFFAGFVRLPALVFLRPFFILCSFGWFPD
jgi:hypothetical protein